MAEVDQKIFVSIAAYRDPDCLNTVRDLFAKAAAPGRLALGVCWQFKPGEDRPFLDVPEYQSLIRQICIPISDSRGPCWARSCIQRLIQDEGYYFQIDSHMRFAPGWDQSLIETLQACRSPNPVLSTYPLPFVPPDALAPDGIVEIRPRYFDKDGVLHQHSALLAMPASPAPPVPAWFVSAGMLFAPARIVEDVPYDPHLYFLGEEISLAVRLWTHGWDIFNPNRVIAYHNYQVGSDRKRHWEDMGEWPRLNQSSVQRLQGLLGLGPFQETIGVAGGANYGLGFRRTLAAYEKASGLDFKARTWQGRPLLKPPAP